LWANSSDLEILTRLDAEIFGVTAWSENQWAGELSNAQVSIEFRDGQAVGFISASKSGDDFEIRKVGVLAESRRAGIARKLVDTFRRGGGRLLIEVAANNESAIAFYHALTFREISRRKKYYADGADAIVMAAT